jgi:hypothetical protein
MKCLTSVYNGPPCYRLSSLTSYSLNYTRTANLPAQSPTTVRFELSVHDKILAWLTYLSLKSQKPTDQRVENHLGARWKPKLGF